MIPWLTLLATALIFRITLSDKKAIYLYVLGGAYLFTFFVIFVDGLVNDYQVNYRYQHLECIITDAKVQPVGFASFILYRPELTVRFLDAKDALQLKTIPITIANTAYLRYLSASDALKTYPIQTQAECWIDPNNPDRIVLERAWFTALHSRVLLLLSGMLLSVMLLVRAWRWLSLIVWH